MPSDSQLDSKVSISVSSVDIGGGNKIKQNKIELQLKGLNLTKLDFLEKFIREFPKIHHIDVTRNQIGNQEMKRLLKIVQKNQYIQDVEF